MQEGEDNVCDLAFDLGFSHEKDDQYRFWMADRHPATGEIAKVDAVVAIRDPRTLAVFVQMFEWLDHLDPDTEAGKSKSELLHSAGNFIAKGVYGETFADTEKTMLVANLREASAIMGMLSEAMDSYWPALGTDFPRFWELLKFLLGSKNRERLFTPAYNDLLADHLESKLPKYQTTWARRWIQFCFFARTTGLVVQCMGVGLRGAAAAVIVPVAVREAVIRWWYGG